MGHHDMFSSFGWFYLAAISFYMLIKYLIGRSILSIIKSIEPPDNKEYIKTRDDKIN
jgi:hypothetical protein